MEKARKYEVNVGSDNGVPAYTSEAREKGVKDETFNYTEFHSAKGEKLRQFDEAYVE